MSRTILVFSSLSLCTMLAACSSSSSPTPVTDDASPDAVADSTSDSTADSTSTDAQDSTADSSGDSAGYDSFTNGGDGGLAQACTAQGGTVSTQLCCGATGDFPNVCGVGACSCAPSSSHDVKVCTCPSGKCWDGAGCVTAP